MAYTHQSFKTYDTTAGVHDYRLREKDFPFQVCPLGERRISVSVPTFKFKGVEIRASGTFTKHNSWNEWTDQTPRTATTSVGRHEFSVNRPGSWSEAPYKTAEAFRALIAPLVASWVSDHAAEMDEAETVARNN